MDQKFLFLINRQWTDPSTDRFMAVLSSFDVWLWPMLLLALLLWKCGPLSARLFMIVALVIVAFNDGLLARYWKRLADRPRPHQALSDVRQVELARATPRLVAVFKPVKVKLSRSSLHDVEGRSFPSSHTINTISVATLCAGFYRRAGWVAFIPALLVGYSRIYTGSHWPSDIIGSVFIGIGATFLLLALCEFAWRKIAPRIVPRIYAARPTLLGT